MRHVARRQVIELGFYSNGWMTLFVPKRDNTDALTREEFVANIADVKEFFGIRSSPNAPRIHNIERKYWAIPAEFVRKYSDATIERALKDIWARRSADAEIEVYYHQEPFMEAGDLS